MDDKRVGVTEICQIVQPRNHVCRKAKMRNGRLKCDCEDGTRAVAPAKHPTLTTFVLVVCAQLVHN